MEREMNRWEYTDGVLENARIQYDHALSRMEAAIRSKLRDIPRTANHSLYRECALNHFENYWNSIKRNAEDIATDSWHEIITYDDMMASWDNIAATVRDQIPQCIQDAITDANMEAALRGFFAGKNDEQAMDGEYVVFCAWAAGLTQLTAYPAFQLFSNGDPKTFLTNARDNREAMLSWAHRYVPIMMTKDRGMDFGEDPIIYTTIVAPTRELSFLEV